MPLVEVVDDLARVGAHREDARDARLAQRRLVLFGNDPPTISSLSPPAFSRSSRARSGILRICPAESEEMPTTSTSSWIAVFATISGVCLSPVKITSMPASRSVRDHGDADGMGIETELGQQHADGSLRHAHTPAVWLSG